VIGGTTSGAGNVVSGNGVGGFGYGIFLNEVPTATIQGNMIGTNAAGTAAIGNFQGGILVGGPLLSPSVLIGGSTAAARNVVSGNGSRGGVYVNFGQATIQGNYIGVGATGVTPIPNAGPGVRIDSAVGTVGGAAAGQGNVIANNLGGVDVLIGSPGIRSTSNASILYGSFGSGTAPHLLGHMLSRISTKAQFTHVPYRGFPQVMQAIMVNEVDLLFDAVPGTLTLMRAGKVIPLAPIPSATTISRTFRPPRRSDFRRWSWISGWGRQ